MWLVGVEQLEALNCQEGMLLTQAKVCLRVFVTSDRFSTLEGIAQRQIVERFVGAHVDGEGEGMLCIPPVEKMFRQGATPKERTKYYPSQSAKSLLKDFFGLNPPAHLDPSHPTTSLSAGQMIQFARTVGLEV